MEKIHLRWICWWFFWGRGGKRKKTFSKNRKFCWIFM